MANEIRRRVDFAAGGLSVGLNPGDVTMQSNGLQDLPALAADEYFPLSLYRLDALGRVVLKEVVHMTAHSAAAGSGTIVRAREGTTAQTWNAGDRWSLTDTALDNVIICKSTTRPATPYEGMRIYERDTTQRMFWNGSNWVNEVNFRMHAAGSSLVGGGAPAIDTGAIPFKIQAGTFVSVTNGGGGTGPIAYPVAFPNGVLAVMAINGDAGATDQLFVAMYQMTLTHFEVICMHLGSHARYAGATVRINWIAVGW